VATRNERKRKAQAKRDAINHALAMLDVCRAIDDGIRAKREAAINAVHEWGRPIKGLGLTHSTVKAFVKRSR